MDSGVFCQLTEVLKPYLERTQMFASHTAYNGNCEEKSDDTQYGSHNICHHGILDSCHLVWLVNYVSQIPHNVSCLNLKFKFTITNFLRSRFEL